jgi:hypothetical protein
MAILQTVELFVFVDDEMLHVAVFLAGARFHFQLAFDGILRNYIDE